MYWYKDHWGNPPRWMIIKRSSFSAMTIHWDDTPKPTQGCPQRNLTFQVNTEMHLDRSFHWKLFEYWVFLIWAMHRRRELQAEKGREKRSVKTLWPIQWERQRWVIVKNVSLYHTHLWLMVLIINRELILVWTRVSVVERTHNIFHHRARRIWNKVLFFILHNCT